MGKITVKHYVNKSLKQNATNGKEQYPVYVQVIALSKNLKFKSNNGFFEYMSEDSLNNNMVQSILRDEALIIENVVEDLIKKGRDEQVTSKLISLYTRDLNNIIDANFCKLINEERKDTNKFVPNVILGASYFEINELVFFWNESSPLEEISSNIDCCYNAIRAIYDIRREKRFIVYDLYEGTQKDEILEMINMCNNFDEEETRKGLVLLQRLSGM